MHFTIVFKNLSKALGGINIYIHFTILLLDINSSNDCRKTKQKAVFVAHQLAVCTVDGNVTLLVARAIQEVSSHHMLLSDAVPINQ